jgi:hypothetical protein
MINVYGRNARGVQHNFSGSACSWPPGEDALRPEANGLPTGEPARVTLPAMSFPTQQTTVRLGDTRRLLSSNDSHASTLFASAKAVGGAVTGGGTNWRRRGSKREGRRWQTLGVAVTSSCIGCGLGYMTETGSADTTHESSTLACHPSRGAVAFPLGLSRRGSRRRLVPATNSGSVPPTTCHQRAHS